MKRAVQLTQYRNTHQFAPPAGVLDSMIDPNIGKLATPSCTQTQEEYFVAGTEPTQYCQLHGGGVSQSAPVSWLAHLFGKGPTPPPSAQSNAAPSSAAPNSNQTNAENQPQAGSQSPENAGSQQQDKQEKKKGIFGKNIGIFGGDDKQSSGKSK